MSKGEMEEGHPWEKEITGEDVCRWNRKWLCGCVGVGNARSMSDEQPFGDCPVSGVSRVKQSTVNRLTWHKY